MIDEITSVNEDIKYANQQMSSEDQKTFSRIWGRFLKMDSIRSEREAEWNLCDDQMDALVTEDNLRKLNINDPLEKVARELYLGKQSGKLNYWIEPDEQCDEQELTASKYILDHYIKEEWFTNQKTLWESAGATYGVKIFYTGIRMEVENVFTDEEKETDASDKDTSGFWDNGKSKLSQKIKWMFTPVNISTRHVWIDDRVMYQSEFEKAEDCFIQENISVEKFRLRYGGVKWFKYVDSIAPMGDDHPAYRIQSPMTQQIIMHHYYNVTTKEYALCVNKTWMINYGRMRYDELPIVVAQHYIDPTKMYGESVCKRLRYHKAYINGMLQSAFDSTRIGSGINIGIGWGGDVDGELYTASGEVNIWRFNNGIDQVQQFPLQSNVPQVQNILAMLKDLVRRALGDDPDASFAAPADQLGTVEIIEENKAIRQKTVEERRDQALSKALTQCLKNIKEFAPALMSQETKDEEGNVRRVYPMIKVENVSVKKKWKTILFEEDYGKMWFFEFKPDSFKLPTKVQIITPGNRTQLRVIEKNSVRELVGNVQIMSSIYWPEQVAQIVPLKELWDKMSLAYWYDYKLNAQTKKDKIKEQIDKQIEEMQQKLWVNSLDINEVANENPMMGSNSWQPAQDSPQWAQWVEEQQSWTSQGLW